MQKWGHGPSDSQCIWLNHIISRVKPFHTFRPWWGRSFYSSPYLLVLRAFDYFNNLFNFSLKYVIFFTSLKRLNLFASDQDSMKHQTRFVSQKPAKVVLSSMEVVAQSMGFKTHIRNYKVNLYEFSNIIYFFQYSASKHSSFCYCDTRISICFSLFIFWVHNGFSLHGIP